MELYQKASQLGSLRGQAELGHMYLSGWGVDKDYVKAYELSEKAANLGVACGQCNLGVMYEYGLGVARDVALAHKWYKKAADQGDMRGLCNLGYLYERGRGVPEDEEKAKEIYQKAMDQGYMFGHFNVSEMFDFKLGKLKDKGRIQYIGVLTPYREINIKDVTENPYCQEKFDMDRRFRIVRSNNNFYYLECYTKPSNNQESSKVIVSIENLKFILRKYPTEKYELTHAESLCIQRLYEFYRSIFEKMDTLEIYRQFKRFHNVSQCKELFNKLAINDTIEDFILVKRIAEEENEPLAYKKLGDCFFYGQGTVKDYKEAFRCYKKATTSDNQEEIIDLLQKVNEAITNDMIFQQAMNMLETSNFQNAIVSWNN